STSSLDIAIRYRSSLTRRAPCREPAATSIRVRSGRRCDDVRGLGTLGTLDALDIHTLAFGEGLEAVHRDRGEVDEDVVPTLALDEAVALLVRKPLDGALLHYLSSYSAARTLAGRRRRSTTGGTLAPMSRGPQPANDDVARLSTCCAEASRSSSARHLRAR